MFEFITTDIRKPLPESIEDLIKMDYKVRTTYGVPEYEKILNGREGPEFYTEIYSEEYDLIYEAVLNGSIKSKYAFLIHTEDHARLNSTFKKSLPIMKNERLTKTVHISMMRVNIISQPLDDVIDELIPSGILQHENDYGMWYMHRPVDVEVKDPKRILSMSDLEFGFVTFLGVLSLSIVVFICELHALYVRRQLRKLLGLYEFIRVIRERFKDYHDRMEIRYPKKRRKKNKKNSVLNVFETTFACLIIFLALFVEISCEYVKYKSLKDTLDVEPTEPVLKSIADVINEFYIKNNIDFDFIIYGNTTNHINDAINGLKDTFPTVFKHIPDFERWDHNLNRSAIFFMNSLNDLQTLHEKSKRTSVRSKQFTNLEPRNFKFMVYIENAGSYKLVESKIQSIQHEVIGRFSDLTFYEFLIFKDKEKIILAANVLYSEKKCAEIHLKELNRFVQKVQKWEKKLENFDHYANFHSCMINFEVSYLTDFVFKKSSMSAIHEMLSNDKVTGVVNTLLEIFAAKHNFTIHYTKIKFTKQHGTRNYLPSPKYSFFISTNMQIKLINIDFTYFSQPLYLYDCYFLISYNDLYTNYEKLTFPFDTTSWVLVFFIFGSTFTSIFGLHFCPRWLRTIVFGKGIIHPAYNALGIFFGIAQLRLPRESFCRSILIIYLCFCLIIRTCWQSKMFEFTTTDMRKPLPESIEDLLSMNYKVIGPDEDLYKEILNGRNGPVFESTIHHEFKLFYIYKDVLNGIEKTKYAFLVKSELHAILNGTYQKSLPIMKNERITKQDSITMIYYTFISQPINDIINDLIPSGILQHENDYDLWYRIRPVDVEVKDPRRILSMTDLEFGFVIFLGFLSLSIVAFICEILSLSVRRQLRKLLGLYEFIRIVRERLKDYHDRW
ncbi:hypothetical protein PVAND_009055 [Polypedilum vanderplanki]|uniref:Ionotropic receptor n=1 Tax=Polypedilum vanderplanki TaxID=319348 RepID=A0A9J6CCL2_POLVA|nr:hypothetical protein PVAND_009055 [Polypedilum vanderplanki]